MSKAIASRRLAAMSHRYRYQTNTPAMMQKIMTAMVLWIAMTAIASIGAATVKVTIATKRASPSAVAPRFIVMNALTLQMALITTVMALSTVPTILKICGRFRADLVWAACAVGAAVNVNAFH